jgi:hypothetical protein
MAHALKAQFTMKKGRAGRVVARAGEELRRHLRRLGLWHPDRLTLIVGDHDIFHTPYRGSALERATELALAFKADALNDHRAFCELASELVPHARRSCGDLFPSQKNFGDVSIVAADTTALRHRAFFERLLARSDRPIRAPPRARRPRAPRPMHASPTGALVGTHLHRSAQGRLLRISAAAFRASGSDSRRDAA